MAQKDVNFRVIELVSYLVEHKQVSRASIASSLNVTTQYIYNIKIGRNNVNIDMLIGLHEIYHVSIDWLLLGTGSMFTEEVVDVPKHELTTTEALMQLIESKDKTIQQQAETIGRLTAERSKVVQ